MNNAFVYKITRADDKIYIGITIDSDKRLKTHTKSKRFEIGIKSFDLLHSNIEYSEAEILEEYYIALYNSYYDGLNESINGKGNHLAPNFNTLGFKFSEESKLKMSVSAKKSNHGHLNWPKMTNEHRKYLSSIRKGICWRNKKITNDVANTIIDSLENKDIEFSYEFIEKHVRDKDIPSIGIKELTELKTKNHKPLSYRMLLSAYYAQKLNVTASAINAVFKTGRTYANAKHHSER